MRDINEYKANEKLIESTVEKAKKALRKKRMNITAYTCSFAAILALFAFFFSFGANPRPDAVIQKNSQPSQTIALSTSEPEQKDASDYYKPGTYIREFASVPIKIKEENIEKSGIVFTTDSPLVVKIDDYEAISNQLYLSTDDVCHMDASAKLQNYEESTQAFDTYVVLFPASENIRYDEMAIMQKSKNIYFYYTSREEDEAQNQKAVKGFLVAVAKEADCADLIAEKKDWENIDSEYRINILVDILSSSPSKHFDREHSYAIAHEQMSEIDEIYYMGYPAVSVLRDMRYDMEFSGEFYDPNKASLLDGLLNMLIQYQVSKPSKNNTVDTAIQNYLYEHYNGMDNQPINSCLLFSFAPCDEDYSKYDDGYITYYMMIYEDRIISIHENDSLFFTAKIKVKQNKDETWEIVSFERAITEDETYALFGNKASSYYNMLVSEEAILLTQRTQEVYRSFLGKFDKKDNINIAENLCEANRSLLASYDTQVPEYALKAELMYYAISDLNYRSDYPIIPEVYIFNQTRTIEDSGKLTVYIYGYTGIFSFVPPYSPKEYYAAFSAKLSKPSSAIVSPFELEDLTFAQTEEEINNIMGEYAGEVLNAENTFIKSSLLAGANEIYNSVLKGHMPTNQQSEKLTSEFEEIEQYLASKYSEISSTYPAISRDMNTYILDESKDDDALQIAAVYPLSEDFDNPITVAVLAATYDGSTMESQPAKLYVVKAEYDKKTWNLINIESEERQTLSSDEFVRLQYRSFNEVYEVLFRELTANVNDVNSHFGINLPLPLERQEELTGGYLNLNIQSGVSRFINVSRIIRAEKDSGTLIPIWLTEENPAELSGSRFAEAVQGAKWNEVGEGQFNSPYSKTALGFLGYIVNIQLENENGLYKFEYIFDTLKNRVSLTVSHDTLGTKYYTAEGKDLCVSGIDTFTIATDVSEYMVNEEKGPSLPEYREELRYITPIVGDMPGGIMSIETLVGSSFLDLGYEDNIIKNESKIIDWAQSVGEVLQSGELLEISNIPLRNNPDVSWKVTLAAQEGKGTLQIIGFADTEEVYIRKVYRLYGSTEPHEQYFTFGDCALFDTLCELSFGKTIE